MRLLRRILLVLTGSGIGLVGVTGIGFLGLVILACKPDPIFFGDRVNAFSQQPFPHWFMSEVVRSHAPTAYYPYGLIPLAALLLGGWIVSAQQEQADTERNARKARRLRDEIDRQDRDR